MRRPWSLAIAVLVLGAAGAVAFVTWRGPLGRDESARALDVIDEAVQRSWRGEARIVVRDGGVPLPPHAPIVSSPPVHRESQLALALTSLSRRAAQSSDSHLWNSVGIGRLVQGRDDDAITAFELASGGEPDARVLTNLSAAYMVRGEPGDRIRALDVAMRSVVTGHAPAEAWYNAALASEQVLPPEHAVVAWMQALEYEPAVEWRVEIGRRLAVLQNGHTHHDIRPESLRDRLNRDLLPRLAQACAASLPDVARELAHRAGSVAGALSRYTADRYPTELVGWLGREQCDRDRAMAYEDLHAALDLYDQDRRDGAMVALESLVPRLQRLGSPAVVPARLYLAICRYFSPRALEALPLLDAVAIESGERGFYDVLGRTEWARGYIAEDRTQFDRARERYRTAITAYGHAANADGARAVASLDATLSDTLGNYREGWTAREESLDGMRPGFDRRALHGMLRGATRAAMRDGYLLAARAFATVRITAARADNAPIRIVEAAIDQARVEYALGLRDEAQKTLDEALSARARIDSEGALSRNDADLAVALAQLANDAAVARARLTDALGLYDTVGSSLLRGRLLLHRARAAIAAHDDAAGERDLLEGISSFETIRRQLASTPARLSYFEEAWELFDELVTLRVRQRRMVPALDVLERGRGPVLRDILGTGQSPQSLARALPATATVLTYAVLDGNLIIWILRNGEIRAVTRPVGRQALQALVASVREDARTEAGSPATRLYDLLVAPVESDLVAGGDLYVVPDPLLHNVPFAMLWRTMSQQYLVERHTVVTLPSLSLAQIDPGASDELPPAAALVVAAPNGGHSDGLASLPAAAREGEAIAALYPGSRFLTGSAVDTLTVTAALRAFPLVHFTGHAIVHPENPQLSRLLLSDDPDGGRLYARDLEALDLRHVKTVTLAACSTAAGRTYRSEGVVSLARSFVERGVRRVVATLWEIDDQEASRVFLAVHEEMRKGHNASDAVASVQRQAIRAGQIASSLRTIVVISRIVDASPDISGPPEENAYDSRPQDVSQLYAVDRSGRDRGGLSRRGRTGR